jgi:hypothetical protein
VSMAEGGTADRGGPLGVDEKEQADGSQGGGGVPRAGDGGGVDGGGLAVAGDGAPASPLQLQPR